MNSVHHRSVLSPLTMNRTDYLFSTTDLNRGLEATANEARTSVDAVPAERFLNTAHEDLVSHFVQKHSVEAVKLLKDQMHAQDAEAQIDVSRDTNRYFSEPGRSYFRPGHRITVFVPFSGEAQLLRARPSTYNTNPPRAAIAGNEIVLVYEMADDASRDIKPELDRTLASIQQHLDWQAAQISVHNNALPAIVEAAVIDRRRRLLANSQRLASLGIPVNVRNDAPTTYAIPTVRRTAIPTLPPATTTPFEPEPTWAIEQYEHALKVIQQMALVMERSPSAFRTMDEEALRQHFLVQLNGQFEGRATGETFNLSGKTDILLKEGSRNAFIAECKFWKGPKKFSEAIDQLLGYTSWRDSKTAILVFNRGTDTTTVLQGIQSVCKAHPNMKKVVDWPHASGFRYVFHQPEDRNRELIITVLVFDVPA